MKRRWAIVVVVGGLLAPVILMSAGSAAAAAADEAASGDPAVCGTHLMPITTDVRLTHDVDCGPVGVVFVRSVTFDLAGYTLRALAIVGEAHDLIDTTFTSGHLVLTSDYITGVRLHFSRVTVSGSLALKSNGTVSLDHSFLDGNVRSGGSGNILNFIANDSTIRGSVAATGGILTVHRSVFIGNIYSVNYDAGIRFALDRSLIVGSLGISLTPVFPPGDVQGDISHNLFIGGGVSVGGASLGIGPTTITDNIVLHSTYSGIAIGNYLPYGGTPSGPVTLRGNLAVANQGHGIDAGPAGNQLPRIVDGGHNRAFLNGTDPQCVSVTCRPLV
jgi:hypothetical protein